MATELIEMFDEMNLTDASFTHPSLYEVEVMMGDMELNETQQIYEICDRCGEYLELIDENFHEEAEELGPCGNCIIE
jgi:hypothetical protein